MSYSQMNLGPNRQERRAAYKTRINQLAEARTEQNLLALKKLRCNSRSKTFWRKYYKALAAKKTAKDLSNAKGRMAYDLFIQRGIRHNPWARPLFPSAIAAGISRIIRGR